MLGVAIVIARPTTRIKKNYDQFLDYRWLVS